MIWLFFLGIVCTKIQDGTSKVSESTPVWMTSSIQLEELEDGKGGFPSSPNVISHKVFFHQENNGSLRA